MSDCKHILAVSAKICFKSHNALREEIGPWTTVEQKVSLRKSITNSIGRIPDWNAILVANETLQRLSETTD
jgi:hypothetical protein